jgi:hypothetical protein
VSLRHEDSGSATCAGTAHDFLFTYDVRATVTINSIWAEANTAPGGTNAWTVTVRKNGLTTVGNSLSCTVTATETACENDAGAVPVLDGDFLTVIVTRTSGTSANNKNWKTYVTLTSIGV